MGDRYLDKTYKTKTKYSKPKPKQILVDDYITTGSKCVIIYVGSKWVEWKGLNRYERKHYKVFDVISDTDLEIYSSKNSGATKRKFIDNQLRNFYAENKPNNYENAIRYRNRQINSNKGRKHSYYCKHVVTPLLSITAANKLLKRIDRIRRPELKPQGKYKATEVFDEPKLIKPDAYVFDPIHEVVTKKLSKYQKRRINKLNKRKHKGKKS